MRRWTVVVAAVGIASLLGGCSVLVSINGLTGGCSGTCADANEAGLDSAVDVNDDGGFLDPGTDGGAFQDDSGANDPADGGTGDATLPVDAALPVDASHPADTSTPAPIEAACTPTSPAGLDDCTSFGALPAAPVIDGVLECGVPLWPMPIVASSGPGTVPSTVRASIGAAYRSDGLYVYVLVSGEGATRYPPPAGAGQWCGDAVELFADNDGTYANAPNYDDPGTSQFILTSPGDTATSSHVGEMFRNMTDIAPWTGKFLTVRTSDGFAAEAFIVAADLGLTSWSIASGGHVGLDVSIDLGDPNAQTSACPRLVQFTIQLPDAASGSCVASCDVREFCTPKLN